MTVCSMTQVKVNSRKFGHCQRLSPPPFIMGAGKWPQILKLRHNMYCMWNQQNVHDVTITLSHNYYTVKVFWSDKGIVIWEDSVRLLITLRSPEVLWCSSGCHQHQIPTTSVPIGTVDVLPVSSVRDLGVHIDSDVVMQSHVTATVRLCFAALRQLRSVRRCLPQEALLTLTRALIISKVDYCCSVLVGVSGHLLDRLQSVLNAAARLVFSARRSERITPLLRDLHWLRVPAVSYTHLTLPTILRV